MRRLVLPLFLFCSYMHVRAQGNYQLIDQYFDSIEKNNLCMGGIAIYDKDKLTYHTGFGNSLLQPTVQNDKKTKYRIGSITKTFTATCIFQLVEEGQLRLNDKVSQYLKNVPNGDQMTIEHLLRHRSGLFNYTENNLFDTLIVSPKTTLEVVELFVSNPTISTPGETYAYSNSNYVLLAAILEKIEGLTFNDIIQKRICVPLKLKKTYQGNGLDTYSKEAMSYRFFGEWQKAQTTPGFATIGAGSMVSTPIELVSFFHALETGLLVSTTSLEKMQDWGVENYGMGLKKIELNWAEDAYGHTGGIDEYRSMLVHSPSMNITIAICLNGERVKKEEIIQEVMQIYFTDYSQVIEE